MASSLVDQRPPELAQKGRQSNKLKRLLWKSIKAFKKRKDIFQNY
jgi:hypothetical protein